MSKVINSGVNDKLDDLLAQPAVISDRGFSKQLSHHFMPLRKKQFKLFLWIGSCWAVTSALILISSQTILQDLNRLGMTLNFSEATPLAKQLQTEISALYEFVFQSSSYSPLLLGLLAFVVLSVFVTEQN